MQQALLIPQAVHARILHQHLEPLACRQHAAHACAAQLGLSGCLCACGRGGCLQVCVLAHLQARMWEYVDVGAYAWPLAEIYLSPGSSMQACASAPTGSAWQTLMGMNGSSLQNLLVRRSSGVRDAVPYLSCALLPPNPLLS